MSRARARRPYDSEPVIPYRLADNAPGIPLVPCCLGVPSKAVRKHDGGRPFDRTIRLRITAGVGSGNSRLELAFGERSTSRGLRYGLHDRRLPGTPDLRVLPESAPYTWRTGASGTGTPLPVRDASATNTNCSRPGGESLPSRNTPCASRLRWGRGATGTPASRKRPNVQHERPCRAGGPEPAHHDDDGPEHANGTVCRRPPKRTGHNRTVARTTSRDWVRERTTPPEMIPPLPDGNDPDSRGSPPWIRRHPSVHAVLRRVRSRERPVSAASGAGGPRGPAADVDELADVESGRRVRGPGWARSTRREPGAAVPAKLQRDRAGTWTDSQRLEGPRRRC